jgi:phosphoglycerate dehydrogenase-like enzyme
VAIANCRGLHADGVRDHVMAWVLAFARDVPRALSQQAAREWAPFARTPIAGKKLVLLGYGAIGTRIAETARAFGMTVTAVRRSARTEPELARVHAPAELSEAVAEADFFVIAAPLTSETRGMVGATVLGALPAHAVVINVSRGGVLDEGALESALRAGRLAGAALDVFVSEPLTPGSSLWDCPRLFVTPHIAGYEPAYLTKVCELFAENVRRLLRGEPVLSAVSRALEY